MVLKYLKILILGFLFICVVVGGVLVFGLKLIFFVNKLIIFIIEMFFFGFSEFSVVVDIISKIVCYIY